MIGNTCIIIMLILIIVYLITKKEKYTNYPLTINQSKIDGVGLFAQNFIPKNKEIFICIVNDEITRIGSLINHSWNPNAIVIEKNNDSYSVNSIKDIKKGEEITANYNIGTPYWTHRADNNWK